MNEKEVRGIVKRGDSATLHANIRDSQRPLSQPLDAEARFAYYHLSHDASTTAHSTLGSRFTGVEPYKKGSDSLIDDYHGPTTTVIVRPKEKESDIIARISRHRPLTSLGRQIYTQSKLPEIAWVIDGSPWSSDILRSSSVLYSLNELRGVISLERRSSERIFPQSSGKMKLSSSYSLSPTNDILMERKTSYTEKSFHYNEEKLKKILRGLQSLGSEEERERVKIEAAYSKLYMEAIRWHYMFLDQCAKEKIDLLKSEYTGRCSIAEEENIHFKKILEVSLDDVMGCCQDSVRMQWIRKMMADVLALHEWVNMNSSPALQKNLNNRDAVSNVGDVDIGGDRNIRGNSGCREKKEPELKMTPERTFLYVGDLQAEAHEPARIHTSIALRPSRPRVLPATGPHEEYAAI
ncbi:hypothetical protein LSM04_001982 [Trypanosoma melophagium]|uniref:uncharacterized protein n=1 Tax=Trypanosoma melophagium TaxID=715481 RepID=UPI00351A8386|nr:hypothetical protein LSM04_001982 [Trypanosoma melophagium]